MYKELTKQISNLTIEYIDQITADGRVNFAAIRFEEREIDGEKVIAMDIYVFQTNFIRHFNTKRIYSKTYLCCVAKRKRTLCL